ncbi:bifunctional endoribonuclease/protein kinase ire1 [Entomophthora muscae]|uniref:Bifunctional endoribonuclease/protein kinase ire1 n=1 Tax=Entomophthora muscae TaxID=34485 RepID=A0ACC2TK45_9FUNG|nr:bifunctional endoribonuclease/protein kinase ire1 [Entomophthora muscae]
MYTPTDLILVATVDGSLYGVDKANGIIKWSQDSLGSPLIKSYHGFMKNTATEFDESQFNSDDFGTWEDPAPGATPDPEENIFIPEPGPDGQLYILSTKDGSLKKFPLDVKSLTKQTPFRFQNRIYLAERKTNFISIDAFTGELIGSPQSSEKVHEKSLPSTLSSFTNTHGFIKSSQLIRLGFAVYEIKVYDETNNDLLWEITVRDYVSDLSVQAVPSAYDSNSYIPPIIPMDSFSTPVIYAFDIFREENIVLQKAGSLVARQIPVPKLTTSSTPIDSTSAFIFMLNGSFYALTPKSFPYLMESDFMAYKALKVGGESNALVIRQGQIPQDGLVFSTKLLIDPPEEQPSEEPVAVRRWLWLTVATLLTLCGFKEIKNHQIMKAVAETNRKPRNKKTPRETVSFGGGPQKARVLEDGTTAIGSIILLPEILGYGSHGTIVYRGRFQKREVAVKRMLLDLVNIAEHEVQTLEDSDDHPYVIRYYCTERCDQFMYLALELCPTSLHGLIENSHTITHPIQIAPRTILYQIMCGVHHLHQLKIVHRDIKPQNILMSSSKDRFGQVRSWRMLISDFGLCKRLEDGQSSFHNTLISGAAAGTMGWRAPECLAYSPDSIETETEEASSSSSAYGPPELKGRITRAVDIFSAGCVFYYVLSHGQHPFGERYIREGRVIEGRSDISQLLTDSGIVYGYEAHDLIKQMLDPDPERRPDSLTVLLHPYFWDSSKKLAFLQDVSDQLESELRTWYRGEALGGLEEGAFDVIGENWLDRMDKKVLSDLHKFRGYDGTRVRDLLRVIRNKKHHYSDLPHPVKRAYGSLPDGFLSYFLTRFPNLLLHAYYALARHPTLSKDSVFRHYFELSSQ